MQNPIVSGKSNYSASIDFVTFSIQEPTVLAVQSANIPVDVLSVSLSIIEASTSGKSEALTDSIISSFSIPTVAVSASANVQCDSLSLNFVLYTPSELGVVVNPAVISANFTVNKPHFIQGAPIILISIKAKNRKIFNIFKALERKYKFKSSK